MDDKRQQNSNDSDQMREEIFSLITQFLTEKRNLRHTDEQFTSAIFYFLDGYHYKANLRDYMIASLSALSAFACTDVAINLKKIIGDYQFENLCQMLENMVVLCCDINEDDLFMAELDHQRWYTSNEIELMETYKIKYERLLKNLKEDVIRKGSIA